MRLGVIWDSKTPAARRHRAVVKFSSILCNPPAAPPAPSALADPMTLPAGWEARTDPQSGRTYYQNNLTKATQWEPPGAPPPPPPPHAGYAGIPGNPGASAGADYLLRDLQATNRSRCFWQLVRLLTIAHAARALHARNGAYISHVGAVTTGYRAHASDLPPFGWKGILDRVPRGRGTWKVHPADMG